VPSPNPGTLTAKRDLIIDQLESSLEKVRSERSVVGDQAAPMVGCLKQKMREECEALQLGSLEGKLLKHSLPEAVRTKSVGTICDLVASFAPLSVDCINQCNSSHYVNGCYTSNSHQPCSWVPGLKSLVSGFLSSEEGLKLEDIPSSMRAHK